MANEQHVERLKEGAVKWNDWRKNCNEVPNLRQAYLTGANLHGAKLNQADLNGARLIQADLIQADLSGANLTRAGLSEASVGWTVLGNVDLSVAKGLNKVKHEGPSTIGVSIPSTSPAGRYHIFFCEGLECPITSLST